MLKGSTATDGMPRSRPVDLSWGRAIRLTVLSLGAVRVRGCASAPPIDRHSRNVPMGQIGYPFDPEQSSSEDGPTPCMT